MGQNLGTPLDTVFRGCISILQAIIFGSSCDPVIVDSLLHFASSILAHSLAYRVNV